MNGVVNKGNLKSLSTNSSISTNFKKFPNIKLIYKWEVSYLTLSDAETEFMRQVPGVTISYDLGKQLIFSAEYKYHMESNTTEKTNNTYSTSSFSLIYELRDKPWGFEISGANIFNDEIKNSYFVSNYYTQESITYVLPRIFLFSIQYKL